MQARPHQQQQQAMNGTAVQRAELQPVPLQSNDVLDIEDPSQQQQHQVRSKELLEDIPEGIANRIRITAKKIILAVEAHTVSIMRIVRSDCGITKPNDVIFRLLFNQRNNNIKRCTL
jgi:hypothetical protein